jgi:photosystem II stability/assembly factor-like uncharacterized protein
MACRSNNKTLLASGLLAAVMISLLSSYTACAAQVQDVLAQPSVMSSQARHSVLLAVTRAGPRLVAVGERGVLLVSDDNAVSWRQIQLPVSTTLTAVQFVDAQQGWAVGHSGVVLHSNDAGNTWSLQLDGRQAAALELAAAQAQAKDAAEDDNAQRRLTSAQRLAADGPDKPFLALSFSDARHGLVVGAYGLAMHTDDGGKSWQSWMGRIPDPQGLHLYAVVQADQAIYLAGEQGLLIRSLDGGGQFESIDSPYEGSYFSLALASDGAVLVGGLRGRAFRSRDQGTHFEALENPVPVSLSSVVRIGDQLLWVNQAGGLLRSENQLSSLQPLPMPPGPPSIAVVDAPDGALVGVGFAGVSRLPMPAAPAPASRPANASVE